MEKNRTKTKNRYSHTANVAQRIWFRFRTDAPLVFLYRFLNSLLLTYEEFRRSLAVAFYRFAKRDRFLLKDILGSKMYLDLEDRGLARELLVHGIHEPLTTEIMKRELKPGQVIIDVGANIGYYALLEAKTVGKRGRIYALEPAPENLELLRRNVKANGCDNIEIFHAAAGARSEMGTIYLSKSHNQHALIKENVGGVVGSMPIRVFALDDFLEGKPYPSLIRMDVEGFELDILRGLKKTIAKGKPLKLFIEIHGFFLKEKVKDLFAILKKGGFRINVCIGELQLVGGSRLARTVFKYCARKLGRGRPGLFYPSMEELEGTLLRNEELGAMALFERS